MKTESLNKKPDEMMILLLQQIKEMNFKLGRFLKLIPEESIKGYKNYKKIEKAYRNALKLHANE